MKTIHLLTDSQLIISYQRNKSSLYLGEIYNRYHKNVYLFCLKKVKDRNDACDICSDTFIKLIDKIDDLRKPELFVAWLFKIATNLCNDFFRARKKTVSKENNDFKYLQGDGVSLLEEVFQKENNLSKLEYTLTMLDEETREIVIQKYLRKKSIIELESDLSLSKSAVKMRLKRAKSKMLKIWNNSSQNLVASDHFGSFSMT